MKIAYCSDLHLEFEPHIIVNDVGADVLVLAGDICVARRAVKDKDNKYFFQVVAQEFEHVIYVMGNHEHYGSEFHKTRGLMEQILPNNVHLLEKSSIVIDDVLFTGGTLWTDMNGDCPLTKIHTSSMMNDYRAIKYNYPGTDLYRNLLPDDTVRGFKETLDFLAESIDNYDGYEGHVVVVTHHAPSEQSVHEMYKHDNYMNGAYRSDLDGFINCRPEITYWFHGHMHNSFDYEVGHTRVLCNPKGYSDFGESVGFELKVVDTGS